MKLFVPTDEERKTVEQLSGFGLIHENIATLVRDGIDAETLKKHFKHELALGKSKSNSEVGKSLFNRAIEGDTASAIWWSKTQMRWSESKTVKESGLHKAKTSDDVLKLLANGDCNFADAQSMMALINSKNDSDEIKSIADSLRAMKLTSS